MNINKIKELIMTSKMNKVQIAEKSGISRTTLDKLLSGADVKVSTVESLAKVLKVPVSCFYEEMSTKVDKTDTHIFVNDRKKDVSVVPLYDVDARAGLQTLFLEGGQSIGNISIPNMPAADGALHVTGDSMFPVIQPGDIIAYRVIHDLMSVTYGEIYILQMEHDGDIQVVLKIVKRSEKDGYVKLVSYNKEHDPMDVPMQWITHIARVVFSIRKYSII